jgi:hypothetical protein
LLGLETSFLRAVAARVEQLDGVLDPRSGEHLSEIRLRPHRFERHAGTDSQLVHRTLLRTGYTAHEIEPIMNALPVNAAIAWSVDWRNTRLLRQARWRATGIVIAAVCWSPLEDLATHAGDTLRPAQTSDVARLLDRMHLTVQADAAWLALASTTGWQDNALGAYGTDTFCAYFQPAPLSGWMLRATTPAPSVDVGWFAGAVHPDDDNRLHERAERWFTSAGRVLAMSPNGLTVEEVVMQTGVPVHVARAFLERTTLREAGRWAYEVGPERLIFLGP